MSKPSQSFGKGRRAGIALNVGLTALAAVAVWLLLNFVATRTQLRTQFDLTRGARYEMPPALLKLVEELRASGKTLEIDTFYQHPNDLVSQILNDVARTQGPEAAQKAQPWARQWGRYQRKCVPETRELIDKIKYYGGDTVILRNNDIYAGITSERAAAESLDASVKNVVQFKIGNRKRRLDLLRDLADIEVPQQQAGPQGAAGPTWRAYRGATAVVSALRSLLTEGKLVAYWLRGHYEAEFRNREGSGAIGFAQALAENEFENRDLELTPPRTVPDDCSLLIILGPERSFGPHASSAIMAYLRRGGRVLMTPSIPTAGGGEPASFSRFLQPIGIELSSQWLLNGIEDPNKPGSFITGEVDCARITVRGNGLDNLNAVTRRLRERDTFVELHRAREIRELSQKPDDVRVNPLLTSNSESWLVPSPKRGDMGPDRARPDPSQTRPRKVGVVVDFVNKGAPANGAGQEDGQGKDDAKKSKPRPGRLAIVSGLVFRNGSDRLLGEASLINQNRLFGVLLANWLVRERSVETVETNRYVTPTMNIALQQIDRARTMLVWVLPALFLIAAVFLVFWRRRA